MVRRSPEVPQPRAHCERTDAAEPILDLISARFGDRPASSTRRLTKRQKDARDDVLKKIAAGAWKFEAVACPCGSRRFTTVALRDRFGIPNPVSACRACGLLQANPRLRDEDYEEFYTSFYRALYADWTPESLFEAQYSRGIWLQNWLRAQNVRLFPGDVVVEIGTGAGGILRSFADKGYLTTGCDFDEEFLNYGRARGLNLVSGPASALACSGIAKLVILSHVFEHLLKPVEELQTIRQLLRVDGLVLIEVPGIDHEIGAFRLNSHRPSDFLDYLQGAHTYHFDIPSFHRLVGTAGYEILHATDKITAILRPQQERLSEAIHPSEPEIDVSAAVLDRLRKFEMRRKRMLWLFAWFAPMADGIYAFIRGAFRSFGILDRIYALTRTRASKCA